MTRTSKDFVTREPFFPGLHVVHDVRNEQWLYTDTQPKLVAARGAAKAEVVVKTKKHHAYRRYDQIGGSCTGFGPVTYAAVAHEFNVSPIDGLEWYRRNQERDRAQGLNFEEGATVASSMETGKALGIWTAYRWIYDTANMERAMQTRPLIAGTNWYAEMFERDREGIVRIPPKTASPVGGHEYTLGAWIKERGLWRVDQTWQPTAAEASLPYKGWCYFIPGELMARLVREEGEIAIPDEVKLPKLPKAKVTQTRRR